MPRRTPRRLSSGLAALTLIVLATAPTSAQEVLEDPRRLRVGGTVQLKGEYNDNFFLSERNKREDFRESLTPRLSLRLFTTEIQATLFYAPSLIHSSLNQGEVLVFHTLDANGRFAPTERLTFTAGERFLRTDDPAVVDPRSALRGRVILTENDLSAGVTYRHEPWSLTPRYALTVNRTEREGLDQGLAEEQRMVHTLGLDGHLDILRRNTLDATYELTRAAFDVGNDFTGHLGRLRLSRELDPVTTASVGGSATHRDVRGASDVNIYRGDVGIRRDVSPRYTVEGRIGFGIFEAVDGQSEQGLEFLLRATYTGRSVRVTTTSGQSFQETFLEAQNVGTTRTRESAAEVRYEATDRLILTLQGRFAENRFLQSTFSTASGQQQIREDVLISGGLEITWRLSRLLVLTLGNTHVSVHSNLRGFSYQNNRVHLALTATWN